MRRAIIHVLASSAMMTMVASAEAATVWIAPHQLARPLPFPAEEIEPGVFAATIRVKGERLAIAYRPTEGHPPFETRPTRFVIERTSRGKDPDICVTTHEDVVDATLDGFIVSIEGCGRPTRHLRLVHHAQDDPPSSGPVATPTFHVDAVLGVGTIAALDRGMAAGDAHAEGPAIPRGRLEIAAERWEGIPGTLMVETWSPAPHVHGFHVLASDEHIATVHFARLDDTGEPEPVDFATAPPNLVTAIVTRAKDKHSRHCWLSSARFEDAPTPMTLDLSGCDSAIQPIRMVAFREGPGIAPPRWGVGVLRSAEEVRTWLESADPPQFGEPVVGATRAR